jgi:hypothetical protein
MNLHTTSSTKEIPQFPNHRITKYEIWHWTDASGEQHTAFKPVYERILKLQDIYWYVNQHVFLVNDLGKAYTRTGNEITVDISKLDHVVNEYNKKDFHNMLKEFGYKIVKGELVQLQYYFPLYTIDYGFIVAKCQYGDPTYIRFKSWEEVFENKTECINWCNHLNSVMRRNYPEITE